jgi:hypothetical protein
VQAIAARIDATSIADREANRTHSPVVSSNVSNPDHVLCHDIDRVRRCQSIDCRIVTIHGGIDTIRHIALSVCIHSIECIDDVERFERIRHI